jgi:hypothetical protein
MEWFVSLPRNFNLKFLPAGNFRLKSQQRMLHHDQKLLKALLINS